MNYTSLVVGLFLSLCYGATNAQSTTGARSGGSTASTGTGYLTPGKRPDVTEAESMTVADEGSSRAYIYVPSSANPKANNRATTPTGPDSTRTTVTTQPQKKVLKKKINP